MAVAELSLMFGSGVGDSIVTVLLITVPSASVSFTVATMVTVTEALLESDGKVTVWLLAEDTQTPPPGAEHETKVRESGRLFVNFSV